MKSINVPALARVEGEGGLYIGLENGKAVEIRLDIYEPPRFFEGFLKNRFLQEVPDITARICGICPVAYQMSSVYALENALGVKVTPEVRALRRLMYCGEYIESHALHIYMLQAPDLLGKESALELAAVAPEVVKSALRLKKIGNDLLKTIGGRSVHPVNACVGGFYSWPDVAQMRALLPDLEWGLGAALDCVRWAVTLPYPDLEIDYDFVALHHPDEYAVIEGDVWSSNGRKLSTADYEQGYLEKHIKHSNALHGYTVDGNTYLVGPLARLNLNHEQLLPLARKSMEEANIKLPLKNPYKSLIARAVELVQAYEEAILLVNDYNPKGPSCIELKLKAGEGTSATEAPRGLLYHRYRIDENGLVQSAKITPPTAQNLPRIEADLFELAPKIITMPEAEATLTAEHLVRAYDPCISCATHFLKLKVDER
ncbi:MAG TPA: Ni/Fe hydrogenase subunit alpha [Anaerolineales bacterium]